VGENTDRAVRPTSNLAPSTHHRAAPRLTLAGAPGITRAHIYVNPNQHLTGGPSRDNSPMPRHAILSGSWTLEPEPSSPHHPTEHGAHHGAHTTPQTTSTNVRHADPAQQSS